MNALRRPIRLLLTATLTVVVSVQAVPYIVRDGVSRQFDSQAVIPSPAPSIIPIPNIGSDDLAVPLPMFVPDVDGMVTPAPTAFLDEFPTTMPSIEADLDAFLSVLPSAEADPDGLGSPVPSNGEEMFVTPFPTLTAKSSPTLSPTVIFPGPIEKPEQKPVSVLDGPEPEASKEAMESLEPSPEMTAEEALVETPEDTEESDAQEASSVEGSEQCVDASYLSSYFADQLVHKKSIQAMTLCPKDSSLPCGTPDHLIRVDGVSTSYREYCQAVACSTNRMAVNSVLSHLWTEEVHSHGVVLTMFDARHPETVQKVLHRAIASGRQLVPSAM